MHDAAMMVVHDEVSGGAADEYNSPPQGAPAALSERAAAADAAANAYSGSSADSVAAEQSEMATVSASHAPTVEGPHDGTCARELKRQLAQLRGELDATRCAPDISSPRCTPLEVCGRPCVLRAHASADITCITVSPPSLKFN